MDLPQKISVFCESHVFIVPNKMGIHARSAAKIVAIANKYADSWLTVRTECGDEADGRSIMSLIMLAACYENRIEFKICEIPQTECRAACGSCPKPTSEKRRKGCSTIRNLSGLCRPRRVPTPTAPPQFAGSPSPLFRAFVLLRFLRHLPV